MNKRIARIFVSKDLLLAALHLPSGTWVHEACSVGNRIELVIEHSDLKEVAEFEDYPIVDPQLKRQDEVIFLGWGQQ